MADINFEHIDPWVDGQGDTGLTSRQKLRRNFEKIKAWMDSVASMLSGKYLSKEEDDEAEGVITFKKGSLFGPLGAWGWVKQTVENRVGEGWAWFKHLLADTLEALSALIKGNLTVHGGDLTVEEDELGNGGNVSVEGNLTVSGLTTLINAIISNLTVQHNLTVNETATITNLIVTGAAHFFKVINDEIKAAGGAIVVTPADGFTVDLVENITINGIPGKRLYWRVSDGQKARTNKWHALDQALCKTDNLANGTTYNASNKFYWSLVAAVSSQPVEKTIDGNAADCHYIDIYCGSGETQENIPKDGNDVPLWYWVGDAREAAAGDEISMLGSRDANDVPRQSALYFSAYTSIDTGLTAPFIASYRGVNDFNLASHRKTYMDAVGQAFFGQFYSQATDSDNPTDIEDMLTGSELKIIYGEGSPLVTQPEQHWTQADRQTYVDRCFYYDISMEPALDGGRFWKWTMQAGESSPTYGWVHVTDGDTLAALEKISNVASDGVLTGGGEKTRVYLEWMEAVKTYTTLLAQMQENNADGDWTNPNSSAEYKTGVKFFTAWSNFGTAFFALATYLNNKTDFSSDYQVTPPSWINDSNRGTSTVLPPWLDTETPPGKAEWTTGAKAYRGVWQDYYDTMIEMRRALDAWQFKKIDEMGDDGLIDPVEKATLRQLFNEEVIAYWKRFDQVSDMLLTKIPSTEGVYTTLSNADTAMQSAIQQLGSYLCGKTPTERTSGQGDWYIATPLPWTPQNSMRNGLQDPPESGTAPTNLYPTWLQKGNDTQATVVDDDVWDYFWAEYTKAKQNLIDAIAAGNDYLIENATADILPQVFIQASAPTDYKEGDHWYQPTTLTNPVTGASVSQDQNGNPIYNHYIARKVSNVLQWVLVNAATTSVFSQLANQIYQAVFDSTNASSLVMRANSIESTVSSQKVGGRNLLLNSDFSEVTSDTPAHFSYGRTAFNSRTKITSGLPTGFTSGMQLIATSTTCVLSMVCGGSTSQPYLILQSGKKYLLSFWVKSSVAGMNIAVIYKSGTNSSWSGSNVVTQTQRVTAANTWERMVFTIDGKNLSPDTLHIGPQQSCTMSLTGLQLEEGTMVTDWRRAEQDVQSKITQLADELSLAVKVDGVKRSGLTLKADGTMEMDASKLTISGTMENDVTINGDCLHIENDLDIRGTVQNSSKLIRYDDTYIAAHMEYPDGQDPVQVPASGYVTSDDSSVPYCVFLNDAIQMVVPIDFTRTKNVVIKGTSGNTSDNTPATGTHPIVVLPSYTAQTIEGGLQLPAFQKTGVQLHVTNSFHVKYRDWVKPATWGSNTDYDIKRAKTNMNAAVLVVADPRLLQYSYHASGVKGFYEDLGTEVAMKSVFVCDGVFSKIICLMPGQTLSLVSQIEEWGDSGDKYVVWYVQNASEFAAVTGNLRLTRLNDGTQVTQHLIGFSAGNHYDQLMLLAPPGITGQLAAMPLIDLYLSNGEWPYRKDVTVNTDTAWS